MTVTFPELCIPFITMQNTTVHDNNKHSAIHHLGLPGSSMDGEASNVVLYQKYSVSDDMVHSRADSFVPSTIGHFDHGNTGCKDQDRIKN